MRILSLNAWGGRLWDQMMPYLADADPDVLCLQEVTHTPAAPTDWLVYRDHGIDLLQRANLFRDVSQVLGGHQTFFCPAARGDLWDGQRRLASEWGLATFVRRTCPVIGQAQDFIHGEFSAAGWGDHPRSRNAHGLRLYDYAGSFPLTIVHMHGLRELAGKQDTPNRLAQAEALIRLVDRLHRRGERLVVCGDFNVLPASVTLQSLRQMGLTDLVTTRGHCDTRTSLYAKEERFADYMLVSPEVMVRRFDVVSAPEVSDHRALLLDLD
jgi:endonuclease/exonuclease/phosphatase family metal-dependent hydrolase